MRCALHAVGGLLVLQVLGALGCAHAPPPVAETTQVHPTVAVAPAPAAAAPAPVQQAQDDVAAMVRGDVLLFGFDQADLSEQSRTRLAQVAEVLNHHRQVTIAIAGNTDERGTEEYNLALGQRRADVARQYLVSLGVESSRIRTVSYGKEHPANPGQGENAWAANRRDDLAVEH